MRKINGFISSLVIGLLGMGFPLYGGLSDYIANPKTRGLSYNPDISVIGNFGAQAFSMHPNENGLVFKEAEVGFQSAVDPFARGDFFFSFSPGGLEIEEGYATFLTLPLGLQLKVGKFHAQFGKQNRIHHPETFFGDEPYALVDLFGEEARLSGVGGHLNAIVPNPFDAYWELTAEVIHLEEPIPIDQTKGRWAPLLRFRHYADLSEDKNLEWGIGTVWFDLPVIEWDFTYRFRPLRMGLYRSFLFRIEVFAPATENFLQKRAGGYVLMKNQFGRSVYAGIRFDLSYRLAQRKKTWGLSPILEYWFSDFNRLKGQYSYKKTQQEGEHIVQIEWTVTMGPHRPHPF